jgi:hemoglobin-like flavoprotein
MAEIAGEAWRPEYERAWGEAFAIVAGAMIEGGESVAVEEAA